MIMTTTHFNVSNEFELELFKLSHYHHQIVGVYESSDILHRRTLARIQVGETRLDILQDLEELPVLLLSHLRHQ